MRFWKYVKGINYKNDNYNSPDALNEDENSQLKTSDQQELINEQKHNCQNGYDMDNSLDNNELDQQEESISEINSEQNMSQEKTSSSDLSENDQQEFTLEDMQESMNDDIESNSMKSSSEDILDSSNNSTGCEENDISNDQDQRVSESSTTSESSEHNQQGISSNDQQEKINDTSRSELMETDSHDISESSTDSKENDNFSHPSPQESLTEQMSFESDETIGECDIEEQNKDNSQTHDGKMLSGSNPEENLEFQEYDQDESKKTDFNESSSENKQSSVIDEQELSSQLSDLTTEIDTSLESHLNNEEENKKRLELLKELRDKISEYAKEKAKIERHKNHAENKEVEESVEEDYQLSEETNQFIDKLKDLPSFENRDRGPGYAIDTESFTDVPESIIRTLITKFLNQRFCKHDTDLNVRSNSLEKSHGFYKWEVKDVVIHLETEQLTKIPNDKYGYQYANGKNETVPLSFYFDMSGSMSEYTNMLAVIAIELLKKGVKVLIGFNERVRIQIDSISKNITVEELANFLEANSYDDKMQSKVKHKRIDRNIDNYLIEAKAEKCCVFSDFDPKHEIINLSHKTQVYWFCFEHEYYINNLINYNGFVYPVSDVDTIAAGLVKVNENRFETLLYVENPKKLRR